MPVRVRSNDQLDPEGVEREMLDTATTDGTLPFDRTNAEEPDHWSLFSATLQAELFTLTFTKTPPTNGATPFEGSRSDSAV